MTDLAALFQANKPAVLGAAAVGVVGLALLNKRKAAAPAAQPAGTIPAAAVVPAGSTAATGSLGTYDSSAYDVYSALQSQLSPFLQAQATQTGTGGAPTSVPAPVASTLFAPTGNGNYVRYGQAVAEVQSDGSLFQFNPDQWSALSAAHGGIGQPYTQLSDSPADEPSWYSTASNLARINKATTPGGA